jgi:hypothetical protein
MGTYFSDREFSLVEGAENAFHSPIPTQVISNGEFNPPPQNAQQKQVEARIKELADTYGAKQGLDRREFLKTSSGCTAPSRAWTAASSSKPVPAWPPPSWP